MNFTINSIHSSCCDQALKTQQSNHQQLAVSFASHAVHKSQELEEIVTNNETNQNVANMQDDLLKKPSSSYDDLMFYPDFKVEGLGKLEESLRAAYGFSELRITKSDGIIPRVTATFDESLLKEFHLYKKILGKKRQQTSINNNHRLLAEDEASPSINQSPQIMRQSQETLSHAQRIEIIYLSAVHKIAYKKVSERLGIPFSTIRQTIQEFKKSNRTNKLLTQSTKVKLLQDRRTHGQIVAERSKRICKRRSDFQNGRERPMFDSLAKTKAIHQVMQVKDSKSQSSQDEINSSSVAVKIETLSAVNLKLNAESDYSLKIGSNTISKLIILQEENQDEIWFDSDDFKYGVSMINGKVETKQSRNNESNFSIVDDQVEKVDYNFFQGLKEQEDPMEAANILKKKNQVYINEKTAFCLYNKVFKIGINNLELYIPEQLR